jgi:hypothetical protein
MTGFSFDAKTVTAEASRTRLRRIGDFMTGKADLQSVAET